MTEKSSVLQRAGMLALGLALTLTLTLTLAGCDKTGQSSSDGGGALHTSQESEPVTDPNWPVTVGSVTLTGSPQSVVSLSPAATELAWELGIGQRLVGISDHCDYPLAVQNLPRCGTAAQPDLERIGQLQPDLILSSVSLTTPLTEALAAVGIQAAVFPRQSDMTGIEENYVGLATLLWGDQDGPLKGGEVFDGLEARYDALASAAAMVEERYSGIWLRSTPLLMATGDSWENMLLEEVLGVTNDAAEFGGWEYPEDKAVDLYPDMLFYDASIDPEYFGTTLVYSTTDAYKQKRMYPFNAVVFERQTGRFVTELHRMLLQVYPELEAQVGPAPEPEEEMLALPLEG